MTESCYPSEDELEIVKTWGLEDPLGWFTFIRTLWWAPEWGFHQTDGADERDGRTVARYEISTGGWSGNEDIIGAMGANFLWHVVWVQSRRGGHYIFEVPERLVAPNPEGGN